MKGILSLLIVCSISIGAVRAEEKEISFDQILKIALEKSPTISKIDSLLHLRLGDAEETRVKKNPILDSQVRLPGNRSSNQNEYQIQLSQPFRYSDFGFRSKVAGLIRDEASINKKLALVEFTQKLSLLYTKLWVSQKRVEVLKKSDSISKETLGIIKRNSERGLVTDGDLLLFESERAQIESDILGASSDQKRQLAQLEAEVGERLGGSALKNPPLKYIMARGELEKTLNESSLPSQERAKLLHKVASEQLELARMDAVRPIAPNLGFQRISDGGQQVTLGLSIELPLFDRNQAQQERAFGAELSSRRAMETATNGTLTAQALSVREAIEQMRNQKELYRAKILPGREKALKAYKHQYESGQGAIFPIWQTQRELTASKLRELDLSLAEQELISELGILLGEAF